MKKSEHEIQNEIRVAVGKEQSATLFRANVGEAWTGTLAASKLNRIVIEDARRFRSGLPIGFPDLFGFRTVTVTPEMVGRKLAVFAFLEVKKPGGRTSKAQEKMHAFLHEAGAVGGIARSAEEAVTLLQRL
nr:MAG TPA: Nuclease [Caudoviricetes sp.]